MLLKTNIQQLIEVTKPEGKEFLICQDGEWKNINEDEYNKIIEGENNDRV